MKIYTDFFQIFIVTNIIKNVFSSEWWVHFNLFWVHFNYLKCTPISKSWSAPRLEVHICLSLKTSQPKNRPKYRTGFAIRNFTFWTVCSIKLLGPLWHCLSRWHCLARWHSGTMARSGTISMARWLMQTWKSLNFNNIVWELTKCLEIRLYVIALQRCIMVGFSKNKFVIKAWHLNSLIHR